MKVLFQSLSSDWDDPILTQSNWHNYACKRRSTYYNVRKRIRRNIPLPDNVMWIKSNQTCFHNLRKIRFWDLSESKLLDNINTLSLFWWFNNRAQTTEHAINQFWALFFTYNNSARSLAWTGFNHLRVKQNVKVSSKTLRFWMNYFISLWRHALF